LIEELIVFYNAQNKLLGVQKFILKILNNNSQELKAFLEGPRREKRVNLTQVVLVAPLVDGNPDIKNAFYAVTKEFSVNGIGIMLDGQRVLDEVILGFSYQGSMTYLHARAKHITPMGGGLHQLGLEMDELIPNSKYPELEQLKF
jgi:hypothetical protein